jgi:hypothetical protein
MRPSTTSKTIHTWVRIFRYIVEVFGAAAVLSAYLKNFGRVGQAGGMHARDLNWET